VTIDEVGSSHWDAYVNKHDQAGIYHLSLWKDLLTEVFRSRCHYLAAISDKGEICAVLPLVHFKNRLFGHFAVSMPYFNHCGVLAETPEAEAAILKHAITLSDALGASHLEFREFHPRNNGWLCKTEKVLMRLNLPDTPEALWKSIGAKRRSQIRRPDREGVSVRVGEQYLLDDFYTVFAHNMRDLGTPVYSKKLFAAILAALPEQTHIVVIYLENRPVAAAFLVGYKQIMEIPWASSLRKFNRFGTNMRLYWEVLKFSILQGYQVFDFGRSTIDGPTYKFKKQWGSEPRQCYWNYWLAEGKELPQLNPQNPKYKLAIEGWKRLPLPVANALGPHIVKHLA